MRVIWGPVAQRLEQGTHNPLAGGSNPSGPTIKKEAVAVRCHIACSYSGVTISAPHFRSGLSSLQMRNATELLEALLDGKIALQQDI